MTDLQPRITSLLAYEQIQATGSLAKAEWSVYDVLYSSKDGLTRNEIDALLNKGAPNSMYSRRLADMEREGAIWRRGTRLCSISGNPCTVWDVTDRMPRKAKQALPARMPNPAEAEVAFEWVQERVELSRNSGIEPPPEVVLLAAWLRAGAPRDRFARRAHDPQPTSKALLRMRPKDAVTSPSVLHAAAVVSAAASAPPVPEEPTPPPAPPPTVPPAPVPRRVSSQGSLFKG